jgi:hypothetical protein
VARTPPFLSAPPKAAQSFAGSASNSAALWAPRNRFFAKFSLKSQAVGRTGSSVSLLFLWPPDPWVGTAHCCAPSRQDRFPANPASSSLRLFYFFVLAGRSESTHSPTSLPVC